MPLANLQNQKAAPVVARAIVTVIAVAKVMSDVSIIIIGQNVTKEREILEKLVPMLTNVNLFIRVRVPNFKWKWGRGVWITDLRTPLDRPQPPRSSS